MKTCELTGAALDWAVAKCEEPCGGYKAWVQANLERGIVPAGSQYSTDWLVGGPIIEQEAIQLTPDEYTSTWTAYTTMEGEPFEFTGPTPLIAAMRCYVASWLGDEIEIPDALKGD